MALRDQPYIPLYVQDFLTDEKLIECSANAHGIYIRLICLLHKSETYGRILLEQKYKQTDKQTVNFASKFARAMPFSFDEILSGLNELVSNKVIQITDDQLSQQRMIRDNEISDLRAVAGSKGGKSTQFSLANIKANTQANSQAKAQANTEYENEYYSSSLGKSENPFLEKTEEVVIPEIDFIDQVIDVFAKEYEFINKIPYAKITVGKERSAAGKILRLHKQRHPDMDSTATLASLQDYFRLCVSINDEWLRSNMSLPILVMKFNEINNKLKNGQTKRTGGTGATDLEIATIVANKFAVKDK